MVKRKAPAYENDQTPIGQFIKMSWDKTDKKGDYGSFVKTCESKWAEMSEDERLACAEQPDAKKKKDGNEQSTRARGKRVNTKDPNRKKRPPGPYIMFCTDMREEIKSSNPNLTASQILQELGKRWKALSESEKNKYQEKANIEKEKYLNELKEEEKK